MLVDFGGGATIPFVPGPTELPPMSRRFQFSLRALLVLTTAVCVWLSWHARANRQREAAAAIMAMGGFVEFDEDGKTPDMVSFRQEPDPTSPIPPNMSRIFGAGSQVTLTDQGLRHIGCLSELTSFWLVGVPIGDAGLKWLRPLKKLRQVRLMGTHVTAAGIAELQKSLPNCEIIYHP
jgi:hypothetical protein